jgi:hypothetical protein
LYKSCIRLDKADALLEVSMAVILAVLLLDERLLQKYFLCPEILLPVIVLLSYLLLPCQDMHC